MDVASRTLRTTTPAEAWHTTGLRGGNAIAVVIVYGTIHDDAYICYHYHNGYEEVRKRKPTDWEVWVEPQVKFDRKMNEEVTG